MLDKLTEDQRKVLLIWFFILIFLIVAVSMFARYRIKSMFNDEVDKQYIKVTDYSRYYTVLNILDKYYTTIYNNNAEDVLKMLDEDYKKDKNLNKDNVLSTLKTNTSRTTYKGSLMCSKRLGKGHTSYLVSGNPVGVNVDKSYDDIFYEVELNENEMTFSIKEIDASQFGGDCHA